MLNWKTTQEEFKLIVQIAGRAAKLAKGAGHKIPAQELIMDLTAAHANGCPIDLAGLLAADDGNFGHDVFGIRRHIDRDTGKLLNCFLPRYNARVAQ